MPPRPTHDADRTTAYDLAIVARAIIRETNLLMWSSQQHMDFDNGVAILNNTNHLIGRFEGADGLKTGFTYHGGIQRHGDGQARQHAVDRGYPRRAIE